MLDLREKDREAIIAIAKRTLGEDVVLWAYGSRIRGQGHAASDLDLVVRGAEDQPLPAEKWGVFRQALQDSTIPILIQVFDWVELPESFREGIERDHVVLH